VQAELEQELLEMKYHLFQQLLFPHQVQVQVFQQLHLQEVVTEDIMQHNQLLLNLVREVLVVEVLVT
jgi:hypothetical protein